MRDVSSFFITYFDLQSVRLEKTLKRLVWMCTGNSGLHLLCLIFRIFHSILNGNKDAESVIFKHIGHSITFTTTVQYA